jgi:hypothetical protein
MIIQVFHMMLGTAMCCITLVLIMPCTPAILYRAIMVQVYCKAGLVINVHQYSVSSGIFKLRQGASMGSNCRMDGWSVCLWQYVAV